MTSPIPPRPTPALTPEIVGEDEKLATIIDAVLLDDPEHLRASRRIKRRQARLRRMVGDDAWPVYLAVEIAVNERVIDETYTLVRWAFAAGLRYGRRGRSR